MTSVDMCLHYEAPIKARSEVVDLARIELAPPHCK